MTVKSLNPAKRRPTAGPPGCADAAKREYPRASMKLPVQFELEGGPIISAYTRNVSLNGMQIRCQRHRIRQLVDTEKTPDNLAVLVVMRLQVNNHLSSQVLPCRLSYLNVFRDDEITLGLQFEALLPDQQLALLNVMEQAQIVNASA